MQILDGIRAVKFGNGRAIFCLGFEVLKETQEQKLERIRLAWAPWKAKLEEERGRKKIVPQKAPMVEFSPKQALERGGHRGDLRQLLRKFWEGWEAIPSDELKLAALIALASKFKRRIRPRKLKKVRAKYNRHKFSLLNVPDCKCATCDNPATVRHHIIPLNVGGINSPLNLILICDSCHEEIHPWMRAA